MAEGNPNLTQSDNNIHRSSGSGLRINLGPMGAVRFASWPPVAESSRQFQLDINQVMRDFQPLMNQARNPNLTLSNFLNPRSNNESSNREPSNPVVPNNDFVIDLENPPIPQQNEPAAPTHANNNNENDNNNATANTAVELLRQSPETRAFLSVLEKYLPFALILIAKGIYDHRTGLLVFAGLAITFGHANSAVKREVAKQSKRQLGTLLVVAVNLCACIFFIYFCFEEEKLYFSLILIPPKSDLLSVWDLLWVVGVTDYILKLITIFIKMIIIAIPIQVLPIPKRGKYYLFVEQTSQLYRSLAPIHPWLYYLFEAYQGPSRVVGVCLAAAYMMAKGSDLVRRVRSWRVAFVKLMQNVRYGSSPSLDQVNAIGNQCPICQDNISIPTMLQCRHIFCEECVATWFDRERTCPMCRAQIVDDPVWRDGATTQFLQLF